MVGATIGDTGHDLSKVSGPLLAPGLGAQGAAAADLRTVFGSSLAAVLPSYSREVLSRRAPTWPACGPPRTGYWPTAGPCWRPVTD